MQLIAVIKAVFTASLLQSSVSHDHEYHYNMLLDKTLENVFAA